SHRQDDIGVAANETVSGRMRHVGSLEHADPFGITHKKEHICADGKTSIVVREKKAVGFKLAIAIKINIETELAGWQRAWPIGADVHRGSRVELQVGHILQKIRLAERLAIGINITDIRRVGRAGLESSRIDIAA